MGGERLGVGVGGGFKRKVQSGKKSIVGSGVLRRGRSVRDGLLIWTWQLSGFVYVYARESV